eukprot:scaffold107375_cov20-Tisochrysis_lutea.AAC.1
MAPPLTITCPTLPPNGTCCQDFPPHHCTRHCTLITALVTVPSSLHQRLASRPEASTHHAHLHRHRHLVIGVRSHGITCTSKQACTPTNQHTPNPPAALHAAPTCW